MPSAAPLRLFLSALGIAAAAALMWTAASAHLARSCILQDTPYLPLCPAPEPDPQAQRQALRDRIALHPGDSGAWARLLRLESGPQRPPVLKAVTALAPNDPNVLRARAEEALAQNRMPDAVALLVQVVQYHGGSEPAQVLAHIAASREGAALLQPHLPSAGRWLPQVLASMPGQKLPLVAALPLLAEAGASNSLPPETIPHFIRSLKAGGQWTEAYSLWLTQRPQPVPTLYNGSFDQPFQPDGFDWEFTAPPPSRAGALVSQRALNPRGLVLQVQYTGKAVPTPVIRQVLFVPPGRYVLRGEYMSTRLRMEQGLAWAVRCTTNTQTAAGRSGGLQDTGGAWQAFQFEFVIPAQCGGAANLQLETLAPFEAAAGFRGQVLFDRFDLQRQPS